jgi:hypothetical protein
MTESVGRGDHDREPPREDRFHVTGMEVAHLARVFNRLMSTPGHHGVLSVLALMVFTLCLCCPVRAQQQDEPVGPPSSEDASSQVPPVQVPPAHLGDEPNQDHDAEGDDKNRIFGVLPNYGTVERNTKVSPVTATSTFKMAALGSFDPYVFPFVVFTAGLAQIQNEEPSWGHGIGAYGKRYVTAFSDNTIGNFMTTAVAPTLLHQDPRYFVLGEGGFLHRAGYALSRSVVTRTRAGRRAFNLSEIGGNAVGAVISNAYHPPEDRTLSETASRWGLQVLWDTMTNTLKEFWPDIRRKI